jgi:hypothetical protein
MAQADEGNWRKLAVGVLIMNCMWLIAVGFERWNSRRIEKAD